VPRFAHVPLILGPDKKRLSKRHGATSVMEYHRLGYLPEAMVNFLALLGWSPGDDRELFTREELIGAFTLEGISGGNAVFNPDKLDWFNQQHVNRLSSAEIARRIEPLIRDAGLWRDDLAGPRREWLLRVIELLKPRVKRLVDFIDGARPFLDDEITRDGDAVKKHLGKAELRESFHALRDAVAAAQPFSQAELERTTREIADARGVKAASLIHATRVAVTGRAASPGLFEVLELLGRERVVARMTDALSLLPQ
jgi:glutamyl-tRNA synthetase